MADCQPKAIKVVTETTDSALINDCLDARHMVQRKKYLLNAIVASVKTFFLDLDFMPISRLNLLVA